MRNLRLLPVLLLLLPLTSQAMLIGVSGAPSSLGGAAEIIAAPSAALDDLVTNTAMQGFDEAQGVLTTVAHAVDGGTIAAGTLVDSHMIFLNSEGTQSLSHSGVVWTFDGVILGVMSDSGGTLEAASTFELGSPTTNYTVTGPGTGPAAPFAARGMEGGDSYSLIDPYTLSVTMLVSEPGDWIRVVTASRVSVPEPATLGLLAVGLLGFGFARRRRA